MAKAEDGILRDAIIGTEKEIFAESFGKEDLTQDETGDRSVEEMGDGLEGQHEPEDDDDAENPDENADEDAESVEDPDKIVEPEAAKPGETKPTEAQPEPQGRVPAGRLREEAERARSAIAERDTLKAQLDAEKTTSQKKWDELSAKFDALLALQQRQQAQQPTVPKTEKEPDLFEDPNAYAEKLKKDREADREAMRKEWRDYQVNASIDAARTRHGQVFQDAWKALESLPKSPETVELVRRMEVSSNPGEMIVSWHKRNQAMLEVGDDIDAYKARIVEDTRKSLMADPEFRKEHLASMRGEAMTGDQGRPLTVVKLPRSLSQTPGSNTRAPNDLEIFDGSESATFASAWSKP